MGALVGLGFGLGCLLIWTAFRPKETRPAPVRTSSRTERLLAEAGLREVAPRSLIALCLAAGVAGTVVVLGITRTLPIAVVLGVLAGYLPVAVVAGRARRRQCEFAEVWPEAVDDLASAVRAGMSLPDAVAALAIRGPEPLRAAFHAFALDYQVSGRFGDCLDRLKERLADPVGDRVVEGLRIAREVGGGELGRLLRSLSGFLRDDLRTRSELEARQAWAVNGARVAVAAPWVVLLVMSTQRTVIERYQSSAGAVVLVVGACLCVIAYRLMMRMGRLPTERRILQ
ncbi:MULTISPECIES: type II secretion system F family protein [unclassified Nocardioides]|uniref:type II secretion system F family protein n=1 Tax=unclassified Nocardioides TaxID=2615069 RepID=UPI0007019112|nr:MULTISPECIES: type II secretion system F family protein [unclassified Nocardioides]KRA38181.1 type II secretion system protein F [Nocardioides sp. Root614]KRA92141.1 type II secretion system protein F [Nocardioides sp. Root682]